MSYQIFQQLEPPQYQTVLMYTANFSNLGVQGQLLVVNQGNAQVNSGNVAADYNNDSDYIRIAVGNSVVVTSENYIAYDTLLPPNHTAQWQLISLKSGESVFVYSQKGQCSFTFTGTTFDA